MLVVGFPTGPLQANCYLVATGKGQPCVIIDPGQDAEASLLSEISKHNLSPVAAILTHGHFDHVLSVTPLCDGNDIPAWIHPADTHLLADPLRGFDKTQRAMFAPSLGSALPIRQPRDVRELADGGELDLGGLRIEVDHTPGHTRGSVIFHIASPAGGKITFSGDTLFAGGIGRTDLPGGDATAMRRSLYHKILPLSDDTVILPGHGPSTTMATERANNPFLKAIVADDLTVHDAANSPTP